MVTPKMVISVTKQFFEIERDFGVREAIKFLASWMEHAVIFHVPDFIHCRAGTFSHFGWGYRFASWVGQQRL